MDLIATDADSHLCEICSTAPALRNNENKTMNRMHLGLCQCFIDYTGHIIHNLQQFQRLNYSACKNSIHNRTILCNALINKRTMFHIGYAPLTDETITAHGAFMILCDKRKTHGVIWIQRSEGRWKGLLVEGSRCCWVRETDGGCAVPLLWALLRCWWSMGCRCVKVMLELWYRSERIYELVLVS